MFTVYRHYNILENKSYIGCTGKNPVVRWQNGKGYRCCPKMREACERYDWDDDWMHIVIRTFRDKDEALAFEAEMMREYDAVENGYNQSSYGNGNCRKPCSEQTKALMREARLRNAHQPPREIEQFDLSTGEAIKTYKSAMDAYRQTGIPFQNIYQVLRGKQKSAGKYGWRHTV